MTPQHEDADLLTIRARRLVREWPTIVVCVVLAAAAGYVVSSTRPDRYEASSSLLLDDGSTYAQALLDVGAQPSVDEQRLAQTTSDVIALPLVTGPAARAMGGGFTRRKVERAVTAAPVTDSDVLTITAEDRDAATAARLADTVARQYLTVSRRATRERVDSLVAVLDTQLRSAASAGARRDLQSRIDALEAVAALDNGAARLLQSAVVPRDPASPKPVRDTALAAGAGLLVGLALAGLLARRRFLRFLRT